MLVLDKDESKIAMFDGDLENKIVIPGFKFANPEVVAIYNTGNQPGLFLFNLIVSNKVIQEKE